MIEFIEYTGKYPYLCGGVLALKIDGKEYVFNGVRENGKLRTFDTTKDFQREAIKNLYPGCWNSGGRIMRDGNGGWSTRIDPWHMNKDLLPSELQNRAQEIIDVFNENVRWGCCGGCI